MLFFPDHKQNSPRRFPDSLGLSRSAGTLLQAYVSESVTDSNPLQCQNNKLSCRRETARCSVSLNILLN